MQRGEDRSEGGFLPPIAAAQERTPKYSPKRLAGQAEKTSSTHFFGVPLTAHAFGIYSAGMRNRFQKFREILN
jgi:hypothetical protein